MSEELITAQWATLKAALLRDGGHDRLVEFLQTAAAQALIERAKEQERQRLRMAMS